MKEIARSNSLVMVFIISISPFVFSVGIRGETQNAVEYSAEYFLQLGDSLKAQNNDRQAKEAYEKALALDPESSLAHIGLGNVLARLKDYDKAIGEFERVCQLRPDSIDATTKLIGLYLYQGNQPKAIESYKRLEAISANEAQHYIPLLLQSKYIKKGEGDRAITFSMPVAEASLPDEVSCFLDTAEEMLAAGNADGAIAEIEKSLAIKETAVAYLRLWQVYANTVGDIEKATTSLERGFHLEPDNTLTMYLLSSMYISMDKKTEAVGMIDEALSREPRNALFAWQKGNIFYAYQEWQSAIDAWEKMRAIDSESFSIIEGVYQQAKHNIAGN